MAQIELAYESFKLKTEKNITNDGLSTDRGRFVLLFNEAQNKYLEFHLQERGKDDVRYVQNFLVLDKKISPSSNTQEKYNFPIPKNYLDLSSVKGVASKGECTNAKITLIELQTEDASEILIDEDNKPSFKWREALYTVNSNTVSVYTDKDFKMDNILLSYYRYPNQIGLIDPNDPESKFNENIKIEWDIKSLDRIISLTAGESDLNTNNPRFQLQNARAQK